MPTPSFHAPGPEESMEGTLVTVEKSGSSRRSFFVQGGIVGVGTTLGLGTQEAQASVTPGSPVPSSTPPGSASTSVISEDGFDLTQESAALSPDKIIDTACQFCNSHCGMKVSLKSERVIGIHGESEDPVQDGKLCVKAKMMPELVYNQHRLTTPLRRVSGNKGSEDSEFESISWDTALRTIAERMVELRDAGEAHAVANRTTGRMPRGTGALIARLFSLLGSPNDTDVGPVCNDAGANALSATFGLEYFTNGYGVDEATGEHDLGSAEYLLFLGTNQAETHPVTFEYLLRQRAETGAPRRRRRARHDRDARPDRHDRGRRRDGQDGQRGVRRLAEGRRRAGHGDRSRRRGIGQGGHRRRRRRGAAGWRAGRRPRHSTAR